VVEAYKYSATRASSHSLGHGLRVSHLSWKGLGSFRVGGFDEGVKPRSGCGAAFLCSAGTGVAWGWWVARGGNKGCGASVRQSSSSRQKMTGSCGILYYIPDRGDHRRDGGMHPNKPAVHGGKGSLSSRCAAPSLLPFWMGLTTCDSYIGRIGVPQAVDPRCVVEKQSLRGRGGAGCFVVFHKPRLLSHRYHG
jgi:hypothetical protein